MSSSEFRAARGRLGLTPQQLDAALGVRSGTVAALEAAGAGIPGPIALAVQAFADGWRPPHMRAPAGLLCAV